MAILAEKETKTQFFPDELSQLLLKLTIFDKIGLNYFMDGRSTQDLFLVGVVQW